MTGKEEVVTDSKLFKLSCDFGSSYSEDDKDAIHDTIKELLDLNFNSFAKLSISYLLGGYVVGDKDAMVKAIEILSQNKEFMAYVEANKGKTNRESKAKKIKAIQSNLKNLSEEEVKAFIMSL